MLYLDSGTLTPVLRTLEQKGYVRRDRDQRDARNLIITITQEGIDLKENALPIIEEMNAQLGLNNEEIIQLNSLLSTALAHLQA